MQWLRTILALVLALAWMPLTTPCQVKDAFGLQVLRCSTVDARAPAGDSPCDSGICCAWESGQCQLPQGQPVVTVPLVTLLPLVTAVFEPPMLTKADHDLLTEPAVGRSKPWQFFLRAALPVRAPSIAS